MYDNFYSDTDDSVKIVQRSHIGRSRPVGFLVTERDAHLVKEMLLWRKARPVRILFRLVYAALILSGLLHKQIAPLMALALAATMVAGVVSCAFMEVDRGKHE